MEKNVDQKIKEAMKRINELNMSEEEWELYESRQKAIINYNSGMAAAKKEGRAEGERIGKRRAKEETAKRMLKMNMTIEQIMEATELTEEEIKKIQCKTETI